MQNSLTKKVVRMAAYLTVGFYLQCIFLSLVMASGSLAQTQKMSEITLNLKTQGNVELVFRAIENLTDFRFSYNRSKVNLKREVVIQSENSSLQEILLEISRQTNFKFKRINKSIHVSEMDQPYEQAIEEIIRAQQDKTINGKVTSYEDSETLPGVNVVEKGTSNGTVTNVNGEYTLTVQEGATLVFSSVGYTTEEVAVGNRSVIDLVMNQDIQQLQELVVVGYGEVRKSDLTGSVTSVKAEALEKGIVRSVDDGLQGKAAGVNIVQQSGQPGSGFNIRIRGNNSITGSNDPLFVVDGIPLSSGNSASGLDNLQQINPLATINPKDIESIEILKDASAAAIYGARAANGVVLITTKKGQEGDAKIDVSSYYGIQNMVNTIDLVDAEEYAIARNEFADMQGEPPLYPNPSALGAGTDWFDLITNNNASVQNHQLSVRGGTEKINYYISGGRFRQNGIINNSDFTRNSVRANISSEVVDKLTLGTQLSFSNSQSNSTAQANPGGQNNDIIGQALNLAPVYDVYNDDGSYNLFIGETQDINVAAANRLDTYLDLKNRIIGNIFADYEILEGLTAGMKFGVDIGDAKTRIFQPSTSPNGAGINGNATLGNLGENYWIFEQTLSYQKTFDRHAINAVIGHTSEEYNRFTNTTNANSFSTNVTGYYDIGAGANQTANSGETRWALDSYMGRINYKFNDKYLLTFTGRYDGSSRFAQNSKRAFFPSGALGWRVSDEDFFPAGDLLSDMKLRASYGLTGEQGIPTYRVLPVMGSGLMFFGDNPRSYYFLNRLGNDELEWEKTSQFNLGLDLGLFQNRITVTADYFIKNTSDLLYNTPLPSSSSFNSILQNTGEMRNEGFELMIESRNLVEEFKWNTSFNISTYKNKITKLYGDIDQIIVSELISWGEMQGANNSNILKVGEPLGLLWGYTWDGVYRTEQEAAESGQPGAHLGGLKLKDLNEDGIVNEDDKSIIADPNPDFFGGLTNTFSYKGFDLSIFMQFVMSRDIFNGQKLINTYIQRDQNIRQEYFDNRWTTENQDAPYPRAGYTTFGPINTWHVEDGSFLRARNITLGYNLPEFSDAFDNLRVYLSADNLFTLTNYSGFNPDVNAYGDNILVQAVDIGTYPLSKTYTVGIDISF